MKRNPIAAVGLLMAMTCTSRTSMAAGKNHVPNGTFDTDISGWIPRPAGGCSGFFGGVCWSRLGAPNTLESGSANLAATPFFVPVATLTSSCFPVHGGERYTFRVAGTGGQAEAILSWSDDSECQSSPASDTILVNARSGINWTYFQNAVTAPVEAVAAHVLLRAVEPNRVGFDDVRLIRDRSGTMTTTTIACEGDCGDPLRVRSARASRHPTRSTSSKPPSVSRPAPPASAT